MSKTFGRTVKIFLMDDELAGKIKVSISEWRGLVYRIPREQLDDCKTIKAFKHSGIYFLFKDRNVYVGQAGERSTGDALLRRIIEHTTDWLADEWEEVVVLTTETEDGLGRTDISFLENYFYTAVKKAGRYALLNRSTPSPGTVPEEVVAELSRYAETAKLILGLLGYKAFENPRSNVPTYSANLKRSSTKEEALKKLFPLSDYIEKKKGRIYQSDDGSRGYVFQTSKMYKEAVKEKYWFGYRPNRLEAIKDCQEQYLVLTCSNETDTFVSLPKSYLDEITGHLNSTRDSEGEIKHYHIFLYRDTTGNLTIQLTQPEKQYKDVTAFVI